MERGTQLETRWPSERQEGHRKKIDLKEAIVTNRYRNVTV